MALSVFLFANFRRKYKWRQLDKRLAVNAEGQ